MPPDQRIAEIRAREEAATQGPWEWSCHPWGWQMRAPDLHCRICTEEFYPESLPETVARQGSDAEFISHARDDVPYLLDRCERQARVIEGVRAACQPETWPPGVDTGKMHRNALRARILALLDDADGGG